MSITELVLLVLALGLPVGRTSVYLFVYSTPRNSMNIVQYVTMANRICSSSESVHCAILQYRQKSSAILILDSSTFRCVSQWWPPRNTSTVPLNHILFTQPRDSSEVSSTAGLYPKVPLCSVVFSQRPKTKCNQRARERAL